MPQFDFDTFPPQIAWLVITFLALYFIMSLFALPKVGGVMEQRSNRIAGDLDEADRLRQDAERSTEIYKVSLAEARARAHAIHQETRDGVTAELEKDRRAVEVELDAKLATAEAQIAVAREKAIDGIKTVAVDSAGEIVELLTGVKVDRKVLTTAVENAGRA